MSCLKPTEAWQDMQSTTKNGGHPVIFSWKEVQKDFYPLANGQLVSDRYRPISIPCGKCVLCRKSRAHEIAMRAVLEMRSYSPLVHHSFLTLTVDDEHMEEIFPGSRLCHRPFQLFMKKLRKAGIQVRYLMCGEYGEETHRPHYHCILFGWFPSDHYYDDDGFFHCSKFLESLWPYGLIRCDKVNENRIFYVAGYTLKVGADEEQWRPYVRWSRRPGLGANFLAKFGWNEVLQRDVDSILESGEREIGQYFYRAFVGRKDARFQSRYLDGLLRLQHSEKFDTIKASRLSRLQMVTQKLKDQPDLAALAARSLMNRAKVTDYLLARKSRELN